MTDLFQLNDEVEINQEDMVLLDKAWINRIKKLAQENSSGKYRTCIHQSEKDNVHEMLIIHSSDSYVRPHKHRINGESLQFIEGEGTVIIFNDDSSIKQVFKVGDPSSDNTFYYRMGKDLFHMLIIESEFLVFKETTKGPFIRENTIYPNWAPDGNNEEEIMAYVSNIKTLLEKTCL
jgi:cupin fold WbuC family metalloprotein